MWELWVKFYLGAKWGLQAGRQHLRELWETAPKRLEGEDQYICDVDEGEVHVIKHIFLQKILLVLRSRCHHEKIYCFSGYEKMQELGSQNQFLKISNYLKTCSASFPEHRVPLSWSPPWTPFRGCWGSAAVAARDLTLIEADGKCPWRVPACGWH